MVIIARSGDDNGGWTIRGRGGLNLLREGRPGPLQLGRLFQGRDFWTEGLWRGGWGAGFRRRLWSRRGGGHGAFVTFEFGAPILTVGKVVERHPDEPRSYSRRLVYPRGDWHLWIYCCGWQIAQDGNVPTANESTRECIAGACHTLNGQALSAFTCKVARGTSRFSFDLGGKLHTGPYDDELLTQWRLYGPDGSVLTYRSDGAFS